MLKKSNHPKVKETPAADRMLMRRADRYLLENKKRSRRRKVLVFSMSALSLFVLVVTGLAYAVLHVPSLRAGKVIVEGSSVIGVETIEDMVRAQYGGNSFWRHILGPTNVLAWQTGSLDYLSASFPIVASASLERQGRDFVVRVEEREPVGVWCPLEIAAETVSDANVGDVLELGNVENNNNSNQPSYSGGCYWFDNKGNAYKNALRPTGGLVLVVDGYPSQKEGAQRNVLDERQLKAIQDIWKILKTTGIRPQAIRLGPPELQEITVSLYSGPSMMFSSRFNSVFALPVLQQLQRDKIFNTLQYIDFRVQNRAYYK